MSEPPVLQHQREDLVIAGGEVRSCSNNDIATQHIPMVTLPEAQRRLMEQIDPIWGMDIGKHRDLAVQTYTPLLERQPDRGVRLLRR